MRDTGRGLGMSDPRESGFRHGQGKLVEEIRKAAPQSTRSQRNESRSMEVDGGVHTRKAGLPRAG